ncbi:MarR family transcriptional regulator [Streptomyces sp. A3M-1-3]|uniref:MarR family winged helix-turn-helix transcriptional regulator n=1 Tax=Streptomyces sp. A3M-1-3 TaxID=2962044 RepID=UPI0020B8292F|nr:helix-turn-helix domain-containing protein [Streptomyces sp. A3M-1-3]MCP3820601.1 MarR family transcriptional regulator [Streptomyces sp. A3M-1-3]
MRNAKSDEDGRAGLRDVEAFSRAAVAVFRLNGRFTAVLDQLTLPSGLSAARWQILGVVVAEPMSVSGIGRSLGVTRQSVQRIADLLVEQGLAVYRENPAHRRAKLLTATGDGVAAMRGIDAGHAGLAQHLCEELGGEPEFRRAVELLRELSLALRSIASEADVPPARSSSGPA